jgi:predicted metal-dependent HD superfamily phosphohydrolase
MVDEVAARQVIEASAPLALPKALVDEVVAAHAVGRRAYHTIEHVAEVARNLEEACERAGARPTLEVFLAVLFHDAVYEAGRSDNEARSADLARAAIARWLPATVDADGVATIILLTARHGALAPSDVDAEAARMLDADMAILGAPEEAFDRYDEGVAFEYAEAVPAEAYRVGRRSFLEKLAAAPRIFLTEDAHQRLDAPARANLVRAAARLAA